MFNTNRKLQYYFFFLIEFRVNVPSIVFGMKIGWSWTFTVSINKSEKALNGEALWTFKILYYLFLSFIQFTVGKKQGSHQIPQD